MAAGDGDTVDHQQSKEGPKKIPTSRIKNNANADVEVQQTTGPMRGLLSSSPDLVSRLASYSDGEWGTSGKSHHYKGITRGRLGEIPQAR